LTDYVVIRMTGFNFMENCLTNWDFWLIWSSQL